MQMYEEMELDKLAESSKATLSADGSGGGGGGGEVFASFEPMRRKLVCPAEGYH